MNRWLLGSGLPQLLTTIAVFVASAPGVVHACPMCFAGGQENQDAFLYGSIFLMVVPTLSLGGLAYWVYRRLKAVDDGEIRPDDEAPGAPQNNGGSAVVLHIAPRR
jgi:hypothetical protein